MATLKMIGRSCCLIVLAFECANLGTQYHKTLSILHKPAGCNLSQNDGDSQHSEVFCQVFSLDCGIKALYKADWTIYVYNSHDELIWNLGRKLNFSGSLGFEYSVLAISPDCHYLASWDGDRNDVIIWDLMKGNELHRICKSTPTLNLLHRVILAWSPDSRMLAVQGIAANGSIQLWESLTGKLRRELVVNEAGIKKMEFSGDGRLLYVSYANKASLAYDVWPGPLGPKN